MFWPGSGENRTAWPNANLCAGINPKLAGCKRPVLGLKRSSPRAGPLGATRTGSHEQRENRSVAPAIFRGTGADALPAS